MGRATGSDVVINPAPAVLGSVNAILTGVARRYEVSSFAGPLSLKSVVRGSAAWETAAGRFEIHPGEVLILNHGEEYSMEIDALQPVETFCVFFARGWAEDARRAATTASEALLDAAPDGPLHVFERLDHETVAGSIAAAYQTFRHGLPLEESLVSLAAALARSQPGWRDRLRRVPALRTATREELRRRTGLAIEFIHANIAGPLRLDDMARAARLSPFHFHRVFTALCGVTPHRYVTRLRLGRARTLLRSTGKSVLEVALDCGFGSLTSFTALFRRTQGSPPARFRKIREAAARPAR